MEVAHGPMDCHRCWAGCQGRIMPIPDAQLVHDPGHWGSTNPRILILGISKGNTQAAAYKDGPFDAVGFKGIRHRILQALKSVGMCPDETPARFEKRFKASEQDIAFASVIRCSLSAWHKTKHKYVADGPDIMRILRAGSSARSFAEACVEQHLKEMPPRTRLVILLGNTDEYLKIFRAMITAIRGPVEIINEVAFDSNGVRFVHITHPSRMNGHFGFFIRGEATAGIKQKLAKEALDDYRTIL